MLSLKKLFICPCNFNIPHNFKSISDNIMIYIPLPLLHSLTLSGLLQSILVHIGYNPLHWTFCAHKPNYFHVSKASEAFQLWYFHPKTGRYSCRLNIQTFIFLITRKMYICVLVCCSAPNPIRDYNLQIIVLLAELNMI